MYVIPRIECNWGRKREAGRAMLMATRPYMLLFPLNVYIYICIYICNFLKITFTELPKLRVPHATPYLTNICPGLEGIRHRTPLFSLSYAHIHPTSITRNYLLHFEIELPARFRTRIIVHVSRVEKVGKKGLVSFDPN